MTAQPSPNPIFKGWANDGTPLAYGLLYSYVAGTTTPQATYIDSTQGTPNTNPVVLDARGECALWLDPTLSYKFNLTDKAGNQISRYPVDNIQGFAQLPIDSINIHYDITPAEQAAGVTPTNYSYASHVAIGVVLLERYGGVPNDATKGSTNDSAMSQALSVTSKIDGTVGITSATWYFSSPWPILGTTSTGSRVVGFNKPYIKFAASISSSSDLISFNCNGFNSLDLKGLSIDAQGGGRDTVTVIQSDHPVIWEVELFNSGRHALSFNCSAANSWVENMHVQCKITTAGFAGVAFLINNNNGFLNEGDFNIEIRGWSKKQSGWPALYFNGTGISAGNTFGNLLFWKTNFDAQYNTGDTFVPSANAVILDGNCNLQFAEFGMAGWENTGSFGPLTGKVIETLSTSSAIVRLRSFLRVGWFGGFGTNVTLLSFEDNGLDVTQFGKLRATFDAPLILTDISVYEDAAVAGYPRTLRAKFGTPASAADGIPESGTFISFANIVTSSSGNIDFANALLASASMPSANFCHSFVVTLQYSQFGGSGNIIQRMYLVMVRWDEATCVASQVFDNTTANELVSVTFSVTGSTTLRAAVVTGTAHGTGGGATIIYATCYRGAFF